MEIKYTNYNINLKEIKEYEESMIKLGKTSDRLGLKILNKIEAVIFNKREPRFGLKDYDRNDKYYSDYKNKHEGALNDVVERFKLNFFFVNGDCFDYDENIIIDNTFLDFEFWFVLKLRQYEFRLSEVRNFLKYHLRTNFDGSINEFVDFLKFNINEYQTELLDIVVVETVNDLIQDKFGNKLILEINKDNLKLFDALKFYFEKKEHKKLKQLLGKEEIQGKICFRGNANQFLSIFNQLHLNQRVIGKISNTERWICEYFTYLNKKDEVTDFNLEYVHKILATNSRTIKKSNRINVPGLEHIIVKKDN
jgi:hypothetical protein